MTVAIPSYRRERVLIDALELIMPMLADGDELLVLDQTECHEDDTQRALQDLSQRGTIRWIRLPEPSITTAMNRALIEARCEIVLFLDDDIIPDGCLVEAHRQAHRFADEVLIAGRVIQPWQEGVDFAVSSDFHFACLTPQWIDEFMGGNFSVRRAAAVAVGGFDCNFVRTAYRFEAEFAWRWRNASRRIRYEPAALIHHLKVSTGGTRTFGHHLTTSRPDHAVGAYYFALRTQKHAALLRAMMSRLAQSIATRHHLRKPWWIPITLLAELRGLFWALRLNRRGPDLLSSASIERKR